MIRHLAALALGALLFGPVAPAGAAPVADFDWSMADRYGLDADGDGLIDERTTAGSVTPSAFTVHFDACASSGSIAEFLWDIDGVSIPDTDCTLSVDFPGEGVHQVTLTVTDDQGSSSSLGRRVVIQDFLIVGIGDSLASGEGNPVVPADLSDLADVKEARWQSRQCHRSQVAGQARAALELERADPHTSVTFVHLACSGATVTSGLLGPYDGIEPRAGDPVQESQVYRAARLAAGREIDAVLVSIGANDLDFGNIVTACMTGVDCHDDAAFLREDVVAVAAFDLLCSALTLFGLDDECRGFLPVPAPQSGEAIFDANLPTLAGLYADLDAGLAAELPGLPAGRVYATGYPTLTRNEHDELCVQDPIGFSVEETRWADEVVTPGLNDAIADAAAARGWRFVGGVADAFRLHGYCSSQSWVRRIEDSLVRQLNHNGSVHPTAAGHGAYRDFILAALVQDLYVEGDLSRPRDPATPPMADAGGPYLLEEGSSVQLRNGSSDPAGDPLQYRWSNLSAGPVSFSDVYAAEPLLTGSDDADGLISLFVSDGTYDDVDQAKIVVSNAAPGVAVSASPQTGSEGVEYALIGSFADPGPLDTHTGSIAWGDGSSSPLVGLSSIQNAFSGRHVYPEDGTYGIDVTILDDDGGIGAARHEVAIRNLPPMDLEPVGPQGGVEGAQARLAVSFRDPGTLDTHSAEIDWGDGGPVEALPTVHSPVESSHRFDEDGVYAATVRIRDDDGGEAVEVVEVTVVNAAPSVTAVAGSGVEGSPIALDVMFTDAGVLDTHTAQVDWGDGVIEDLGPVTSPFQVVHTYQNDGLHPIGVSVTDDESATGEGAAVADVSNAPPVVGALLGLDSPIRLGDAVSATASFHDPGVADLHSATVDWGDGSVSPGVVTQGAGGGSVTAPHTYTAPGVYTVTLAVADDGGAVGTSTFEFAVVYDPSGGFATGAGAIASPPGAFAADPTLTGTARFGFTSRYRKGANAPDGHTEFRFTTAGLHFQSEAYDWLVVSGATARFKGSGSLQGVGGFAFLLFAEDGDARNGGGSDRFRIKIWERDTGEIVYDNRAGEGDDTAAATDLLQGQISVHR